MLLQRVVGFLHRWLGAEEEVVAHHRPDPGYVAWCKEHLLVVAAEDLIADVQQAGRDIDPHEGEVPLQRTAQPSAERECFGPMDQILLRDFCPEARKSAKDLESAAHHYEQR